MQIADFVCDELGLVVGRVAGVANDFVAVAAVCPEVLVWAIEVIADDRVGRAKNVLGRTVVLLEQNSRGAGKVFFELADVANVCTAKRIDRLVAVTHHG